MTTAITIADLVILGFTPGQIERLIELRNRYSPIEHVCTEQERRRLEFLKWQYSQERITA